MFFNKIFRSNLIKFSALRTITNFLYKSYFKRTILVTLLSTFACFSEALGILTIIPIFVIMTGDQIPDSGFTNVVYNLFEKFGLTESILFVLIFFVIAIVLKSLLKLLNSLLIGNTYALIAKNYRLAMMESIFTAKWNYFVTQRVGTLANAISSEPEKAANSFQYYVLFLNSIIQLSFYLILSFATSFLVTFSAFIYALILFIIVISIHRILTSVTSAQAEGIKRMTGNLTEYLLLLKPIKAMNSGISISNMLNKEADRGGYFNKKEIFISSAIQSVHEPLVAIFICLLLYLTINFFGFSITEIVFLTFIFYRLMSYLSLLQVSYLNVIRLERYVQSILSTINKAKNNKEEWIGKLSVKLKSKINFNNLTFQYTKKKIIKNLSLKFESKKINILYGKTGIGKTTIFDLIIGLYKPNKGDIFIDDVPLRKINLKYWRNQIGYVPQETILLNNSVLENITLGKKYKKKNINFAIKASGVDEFLNKLPKKINSIIGERGIMLSGGQRQRISIARALVRKPTLILLDEATTNLDPQTERKICKILRNISRKITIIAISHNKEFVNIADNIFLFSQNKIKKIKKI